MTQGGDPQRDIVERGMVSVKDAALQVTRRLVWCPCARLRGGPPLCDTCRCSFAFSISAPTSAHD
jgi:hypothetical protein